MHAWTGRTPEQWIDGIALLHTRMSTDAPEGDMEEPEDVWDADRLREQEAELARAPRTMVTIAVELARRWLGSGAVLAVAALSGVADVDAVTVSMARQGGGTGLDIAALAIIAAVAVNTVSKAVLAVVVGGRTIGLYVGAASLAGLAATAAGWFLFR